MSPKRCVATWCAWAVLLSGWVASLPSQAQGIVPTERLFNESPAAAENPPPRIPGVKRGRTVSLNPRFLGGASSPLHRPSPRALARPTSRLALNLFPDTQLEVVIEQTEYREPTRFVARGVMKDLPGSLALFAADGDALSATIFAPGHGIFKIQPGPDGGHQVVEVDPDSIPPCGPDMVPPAGAAAGAGDSVPEPNPPPLPPSGDALPPVAGDYNTIDVMVVYTAAARAGAGGTSAIHTLIDLAIAEANTCYQNSDISAQLNLVHRAEVSYTETGNASTDLGRLRATSDGYLDVVHTLRTQYGADVVSLFTESMGSYAGLGYVMSPSSSGFAPYAFNVVRRVYATGQYVFAHEVGHNIGCAHDRQNSTSPGAYSYSYGHRFYAGGVQYRTVMAYAPGARIPYFSNPDVAYNGTATGVASSSGSSADNAKSINNTAPIVANFRGTVTLVSLQAATRAVGEAGESTTFDITRSGGTNSTVTVLFATANGTAFAGSDYVSTNGTLTYNPGETFKSVAVSLIDNETHENSETFQFRLTSPVGASIDVATTTLTISDDDQSTVTFTAANRTTFETNTVLVVPVVRTGNTDSAVSVRYATVAGTATAVSDFTHISGTLSFASGETNKNLSLTILDDSSGEADEVLYLRLSTPVNTALGTYTNLKVTIRQSDKSTLRFSSSSSTIAENATSVRIGVRRDTPTNNLATVRYSTANGTALAGTHYTATSGTLVFLPGEISKSFYVPVTDNDQLAGNKTFTVRLTSPFDGILGLSTATVTITDDEVSYVGFTLAKRWVDENYGTVPLAVMRTGSTNRQVSVRYATANGTALAGSDYNATSGTLTFAPGETNKAISLTLRTDAITEAAESLYLRLSSPTGTSLGTYTNLEVVIRASAAAAAPALAFAETVVLQVRIESLAFAGPDHLRLHIVGPDQASFVLEGSTNLVDWVPLTTHQLSDAGFEWLEPVDPSGTRRYFRVVAPARVVEPR